MNAIYDSGSLFVSTWNPLPSPQEPIVFTTGTHCLHPRNPLPSPQEPIAFIPGTHCLHPRNPLPSPQEPIAFTPQIDLMKHLCVVLVNVFNKELHVQMVDCGQERKYP